MIFNNLYFNLLSSVLFIKKKNDKTHRKHNVFKLYENKIEMYR